MTYPITERKAEQLQAEALRAVNLEAVNVQARQAATLDAAMYGTGVLKIDPDGNETRIAPWDVSFLTATKRLPL